MKLSPPTTAFEAPAFQAPVAEVETRWSEAAAVPPRKPQSRLWRLLRHPFTWWVLAPTLIAIVYFYGIASPQYVSEARFVVRSRSDAPQVSLGSMLSAAVGAAPGVSSGDAYSVRDFLTSHDAVMRTDERLDLHRIWGREDADIIARLWNDDPERLTKYYNSMVSVTYDSSTAVITLRVRSFSPADSKAIAETLLTLSEQLINSLSERAREDALRIARHEVEIAERRVLTSREALTSFREQQQELDSAGAVQAAVATMAQLEGQLIAAQAELRERQAFMRPDNTVLQVTRNRIQALERQIEAERIRRTQGDGALSQQLAGFERLMLERDFADRQLASATASLETARIEAQRQQLYLARVVEPNLAVYPLYPRKLIGVGSVFLGLSVAFGIGWLLIAGMREHAV
ncbi:capsule biosynthesis protein [Roseomonas sp. HJA6]|uniref:Capsule biosynthesis protein n=1 Tax=Roseomonas alba TaxID=2846776 RepID=A0ABS7A608_9PROT|nr:capsule biosynthesis protein [Neoroseomonas alba]MBW6396725.1 capsule biosynthesis protein [Neoroseomonas alba]